MKNLRISLSVTLGALLLTACGTNTPKLTLITLAGVGAVDVEFDTPFNLRTGVTATGNTGEDYTDLITFASISEAVNNKAPRVTLKLILKFFILFSFQ